MSDEKTEQPTPKKLEDAREKGQTPKSQDINRAANLIVMTVLLALAGWLSSDHLRQVFVIANERAWHAKTLDEMLSLVREMMKEGILTALPFVAADFLTGVVASFAQVGFLVSFDPIIPKFDKVNPGSGIKRLFSVKSLMEFLKMLVKAIALGAVLYEIIISLMPLLVGTSLHQPEMVVEVGWRALLKLMGATTIVFVILGPLDFALQKWLFRRDQRMSKDEVKREHKQQEGDPELKQKRKELAREYAFSAPQKTVPTANVVVTNPTHYAVALRYVPGEMPLPVVVAKGADRAAATIREIATAHHVPIVSNPPLARALHKLPLDEPIPEDLFEAVAAVLRWVGMIERLSGSLDLTDPAGARAPTDGPPSTRH
jgi:type III secretion protein U